VINIPSSQTFRCYLIIRHSNVLKAGTASTFAYLLMGYVRTSKIGNIVKFHNTVTSSDISLTPSSTTTEPAAITHFLRRPDLETLFLVLLLQGEHCLPLARRSLHPGVCSCRHVLLSLKQVRARRVRFLAG
jgi:hypothetical protein